MENILAPTFTTLDTQRNTVNLNDYRGKKVLLYFYPKDMTPGCTTEALGFQDRYNEFKKNNTEILAVSMDSRESHQEFCDKHGLEFPLLIDTDAKIIKAYNVLKEKSMGISRESFLIDEKGMVIKHYRKVNPLTHPQEVLGDIKKL